MARRYGPPVVASVAGSHLPCHSPPPTHPQLRVRHLRLSLDIGRPHSRIIASNTTAILTHTSLPSHLDV